MQLHTLLSEVAGAQVVHGPGDIEITSVAYDSRLVERGGLFVAISGFETDGHRFIAQALERGAGAVLVQEDQRPFWANAVAGREATVATTKETRTALATLSASFFGHPARSLRVIGITGTKGKTTTTYLTAALLEADGKKTGLISSVEFKIGPRFVLNSTQTTTPDSLEVQSLLAQMRDAAAEYAVVESTSHGLSLHRLDHLEYDVAAFTNLYPDHLDFHTNLDQYLAAKGRLFQMLDEAVDKGIDKTAVLNADDPASERLRPLSTKARVLTYGIEASKADVRAADISLSKRGSHFRLVTRAGDTGVQLPLLGLFNIYNSLAAATIALQLGVGLPAVAEALAAFQGVPGRLERIDCGQPFAVVVDFAHTGDALRAVLQTLRSTTSGRVTVVFGAGGDRDPQRRTGMGRAAADLGDFTILCDDNPRTEDPAAIIDQIARAMTAAGQREGSDFVRIPQRREAIRHAFAQAREGDVVLIAGKGHEPYLIVGDEYLPWDDREVAREELRATLDVNF